MESPHRWFVLAIAEYVLVIWSGALFVGLCLYWLAPLARALCSRLGLDFGDSTASPADPGRAGPAAAMHVPPGQPRPD
ncbi:MAG: hypothetical protein AB7O21_03815 [Gammaproteobacteria bacterium]